MAVTPHLCSFSGRTGTEASHTAPRVLHQLEALKAPRRRQEGLQAQQHITSDSAARKRNLILAQASSSDAGASPESAGSPAKRSRAAFTLPAFLRKAEHTFLLAVLLKIFFLSQFFPTRLVLKSVGYTPGGLFAFALLIPVAAGLALLADAIVRSNLLQKKWAGFVLFTFCALAVFGSSMLYDRPPAPQAQPAVSSSQAEQSTSQRSLWSDPRKPRTAADSDLMFEQLEKEGKGLSKPR